MCIRVLCAHKTYIVMFVCECVCDCACDLNCPYSPAASYVPQSNGDFVSYSIIV